MNRQRLLNGSLQAWVALALTCTALLGLTDLIDGPYDSAKKELSGLLVIANTLLAISLSYCALHIVATLSDFFAAVRQWQSLRVAELATTDADIPGIDPNKAKRQN